MTRRPGPRRREPRRPSGRVSLADLMSMRPGDVVLDRGNYGWCKTGDNSWGNALLEMYVKSDIWLLKNRGPLRRLKSS